nr:hypothetical protein [Yoonia sp.]
MRTRPQVLPLGKAIKTRARDEASLLSEIYIDTTKGVVIFGERALVYKQQNLSDPYPIQSPKLWFKDPNNLDSPPFSGLPVTKAQLLAGLLGYAIKAASLALVDLGRVFSANASTILIAHPVWPEDIKSNANNALICVLHRALSIESDFVDELSFSVLSELHQVGFANNGIDVVEPIAAAYELSSAESNLRRLTLVVDVGAGTTDIGLFVHVESAN